MKWKTLPLVFLTVFLVFAFAVKPSHSQTSSDSFNLYFPSSSSLTFQHVATSLVPEFTVTVTVRSGTLNGTNAALTMWESSGTLSFTSQEDASIIVSSSDPSSVKIKINGEFTNATSIVYGNVYTIEWSLNQPSLLLPIPFIFGLVGLGALIGGPLYGVNAIKKRNLDGVIVALVWTVVGWAFLIVWLWG